MAEKQGLSFTKGKHIDEYLSDEEVVQAILKIMMRSKAWQEHMRQHEGAQLRVLSTSGFQLKNEEKTSSGMVATVESVQSTRSEHIYHSGYSGNAAFQSDQEAFSYGAPKREQASQQQVVAGCNCGLVMDVSAAGVNVHESQAKAESKVMVSYSMMQNSYVNTNGNAGYGGDTSENKFSY